MKDILGKLSDIEATAPKAKAMLTEDAVAPMIEEKKAPSFKEVFEMMATNQPVPVVGKEGSTQSTGAGFINVTDTSPAAQALAKAVGDLASQKKLQIVVPTTGQQAAPNAPKPVGTTGTTQGGQGQAMGAGQQAVREKDEGKPGKNFAKIAKSAAKRYGSKEAGERVAGAVRAKLAKQGKLEEVGMDEGAGAKDWHDDMEQWALNKGRKNTGGKSSLERAADRDKDWALSHRKSDTVKEEQLDEKFASQQQAKLMYATAGGADTGVSKKVAKEFIKKSHGQKVGKLPKKKTDEADIPSTNGIDTQGAGLGAGRSQTTLEAKEPQVEVIDNAFNRENYKDLIGKKYPKSKAPAYARVKEISEGAKPDFLDLDKDGNKKESMKKAAADKKKQKVKESMNHRISAARLEGKSHGLRGHAHSGKRYEDLEELKAYHEGYKEGLDECYGQGVYEAAPATPPATVGGMADQEVEEGLKDNLKKAGIAALMAGNLATIGTVAKKEYDYRKTDPEIGMSQADADRIMGTDSRRSAYDREQERLGNYRFEEDEMEEGNLFTGNLAKARAAGKKVADLDGDGDMEKVKETAFAFEAWDKQLKALINEGSEVNEGMSVSISKGQQNSPDSVTITAQDQEADELLAFVKQAGLGLFGADKEPSSAMSIQPAAHGAPDEVGAGGVDVEVIDGHDGIMGLMQKLSGIQADGQHDADYADEEGHKDCGCEGDCKCDEETNEAMCNECGGMMEAGHSCGSKEMVDEVESEDQMEYEVAEDNAPDSGATDSVADEDAEAAEDAALAKSDMQNKTSTVNEEDDEEEVAESFSFESIYRKLDMIAEESTEKKDEKAEKAGKKVAKDIEYDEGHKGKDDDKAEKAGKKVTKDIEYDDKKDKKEKVDEWANQVGTGPGKGTDASFEQDIDFMTKVIAGGLNKPKSTGQTTIPVIAGQEDRMHDSPKDWATLAGIKK